MAIMPAALILESLAQATILLVRKSAELAARPERRRIRPVYLFGSVHAKMQRPVFPGDVMKLEVKLTKLYGEGGAADGAATVEGKPAPPPRCSSPRSASRISTSRARSLVRRLLAAACLLGAGCSGFAAPTPETLRQIRLRPAEHPTRCDTAFT